MHVMAEVGVAAHWRYKSGGEDEDGRAQQRVREWLRKLLDMQRRAGNPVDFLESVKIDLFPDEVYVFTPRGEIIELPRGATAVDFAYAIHSDVGNTCVGARVDRRLVPLRTPLINRPDGRGDYHPHRPPQSGLAQFRGDRQGPRQHPPLSQAPATR
jgi:guanosine-3',5'-bis(diphosphate) 3'-pyrophosphohydrolase